MVILALNLRIEPVARTIRISDRYKQRILYFALITVQHTKFEGDIIGLTGWLTGWLLHVSKVNQSQI